MNSVFFCVLMKHFLVVFDAPLINVRVGIFGMPSKLLDTKKINKQKLARAFHLHISSLLKQFFHLSHKTAKQNLERIIFFLRFTCKVFNIVE